MKIDLKRIQAYMNSAVLYDPAHHVLAILVSLHGWFGYGHSKMLLFCRGVQKTLPPLDHAYTNTESYNILEIRKMLFGL